MLERIKNQTHSTETLLFAISRMLERASYYGFRSLLVLYMVGEILKMDSTKALNIYGLIAGALIFSQIIGALFGDLLVGNKKAIIIGAIIQALGAFSLCISSMMGLYMGLFLVVIGSGFYTPNIISNFGKLYLNRTKLLDSGFTLFYLAINLGSFLGVMLIGFIGNRFGYSVAFVISGILILLSIIPILFSEEKAQVNAIKNELSIGKRILYVFIVLLVVGIFWGTYEISYIHFYDLQSKFIEISSFGIPDDMWQSLNAFFILPISFIAIILWTYFYSSQFFKLMLGFIFGVLSFGVLLLIPEAPNEQHAIIYLLSLFFLGISEIHIAPIVFSILTKYSNPKYLAILISLSFIPAKLFSLTFGLFNDQFYDNSILGPKIGIIIMAMISIGLIGFVVWNKKHKQHM